MPVAINGRYPHMWLEFMPDGTIKNSDGKVVAIMRSYRFEIETPLYGSRFMGYPAEGRLRFNTEWDVIDPQFQSRAHNGWEDDKLPEPVAEARRAQRSLPGSREPLLIEHDKK